MTDTVYTISMSNMLHRLDGIRDEEYAMKIKNSSDYSTAMLRRMISWVCRQLELPVRKLESATFTKTNWFYRGRAWSRRILVRINDKQPGYPREHTYAGRDRENGWPVIKLTDAIDALVMVTAHELKHIKDHGRHDWNYSYSGRTHTEKMTELHAKEITEAFQAQKEQLLMEWYTAPVTADASPPKSTTIAKRAEKAQADLVRWERKLKLAKSKVKKYTSRVKYYQKRVAQ